MRRTVLLVGLLALVVVATTTLLTGSASGYTMSGHFVDDNGSTFEGDIDTIATAGITKGCNPPTNTRFCPDDVVDRGQMAAFIRRGLGYPASATDFFVDDETSTFEDDINAIAQEGVTKGCNPPANTRFCPDDVVTRGVMAAMLRRTLGLPGAAGDHFTDDQGSIFEDDINAIAEAGITKGCNPPANTRFCPNDPVTRGAMAAFLRRALELPKVIFTLPLSDPDVITCDKDGRECSLLIDLSAGREYRIEEGIFQVQPAETGEAAAFESSGTKVTVKLDGATLPLNEEPISVDGGSAHRTWLDSISFSTGSHSLVATWSWDGEVVQTTTVTIRAAG